MGRKFINMPIINVRRGNIIIMLARNHAYAWVHGHGSLHNI
jgi:hypothetical protein